MALAVLFPNLASAFSGGDPFFLSPTVPRGKYAQRPINTKIKRSATILNGTRYATGFQIPENTWLVANIFHNRRFYIGLVPKESVEQIFYLSEPFGALTHSMLRFKMSKPVQLIATEPVAEEFEKGVYGNPLPEPILLNDLILSVEATSPPGVPEFSHIESFFSTRGLVFRLLSMTGRGVQAYLNHSVSVQQIPLNFTSKESGEKLEFALLESDRVGMAEMYNTLFSNCSTHCLRVMDQAGKAATSWLLSISRFVAPFTPKVLDWYHWKNPNAAPVPNLEDDPEFLRLARTYPKRCEELLSSTGSKSL